MKFKDFLRAEKIIVSPGQWVSGKPVKKLLELSKGRHLSLSAQWTWRKISLSVKGDAFYVVIAVHELKENYNAWLAYEVGKEMLVLARLENHGTHPGWHLHVNCNGDHEGNTGRLQYPSMKRLPDGKNYHRKRKLPVSQVAAMEAVSQFFKVNLQEKGGSLPLWR